MGLVWVLGEFFTNVLNGSSVFLRSDFHNISQMRTEQNVVKKLLKLKLALLVLSQSRKKANAMKSYGLY